MYVFAKAVVHHLGVYVTVQCSNHETIKLLIEQNDKLILNQAKRL
jgi:hypothetical protein